MPDLYFYRNPEEIEQQTAEEATGVEAGDDEEAKEEATEEQAEATEWATETTEAQSW